jgi:hypothetical protein
MTDTPIIALYYREHDPMKRKMFLDQSIAAGEDEEANAVRKELWELRYGEPSEAVSGTRADGYLALWMAMEYSKDTAGKLFGLKRARKEIEKNLARLKFREMHEKSIAEMQEKSELHRELLYRECCHMVKTYMELCEKDKTYNTTLCGIVPISEKSAKSKLQKDVYTTAIVFPEEINMQEELEMITKAAREAYEAHFPGEGGL